MPIRFRCAYCNQLMGIGRRKAGAVVRCPKCSGQVVVPSLAEMEAAADPSPPPGPAPAAVPPTVKGGLFERDDFSRVFGDDGAKPPRPPAPPRPPTPGTPGFQPVPAAVEYDVEPIGSPMPIRGIFLTPGILTLAGVLIIILMGAAFFVGWMIGRA